MAKHTAFEILYQDYYLRVFGLCRRLLGSPHMAEDATQETFVRAYKNFGKFDAKQPFWQWIATIANNHCIDLLRQQSRAPHLFGDEHDELDSLPADDTPALSALIASDDHAALGRAINDLPDKYRVPLVLAYFNDSSYDDIAEHLEITRNHVGVLLLRARQQLKAALALPEQEVGQ